MRAMRINGHKVPCRTCKKRNAVHTFSGVPLCTRCTKAFLIGFKTAIILTKGEKVDE